MTTEEVLKSADAKAELWGRIASRLTARSISRWTGATAGDRNEVLMAAIAAENAIELGEMLSRGEGT